MNFLLYTESIFYTHEKYFICNKYSLINIPSICNTLYTKRNTLYAMFFFLPKCFLNIERMHILKHLLLWDRKY